MSIKGLRKQWRKCHFDLLVVWGISKSRHTAQPKRNMTWVEIPKVVVVAQTNKSALPVFFPSWLPSYLHSPWYRYVTTWHDVHYNHHNLILRSSRVEGKPKKSSLSPFDNLCGCPMMILISSISSSFSPVDRDTSHYSSIQKPELGIWRGVWPFTQRLQIPRRSFSLLQKVWLCLGKLFSCGRVEVGAKLSLPHTWRTTASTSYQSYLANCVPWSAHQVKYVLQY